MSVHIASLHVHPIKSCRAIDTDFARIDREGLENDRAWMIVDEHGKFVTQRTHPMLARVIATVTATGLRIADAASGDALDVVRPVAPAPQRRVQVWDDIVEARLASDAATAFFTRVVGAPVELVFADEATRRLRRNAWTHDLPVPVRFPDGYPVLICTRASLETLNARLPQALPMSRFRPNLVLDGLGAFEEDHVESLTIGEVVLQLVKPCTRCGITGIDQRDGLRWGDPLLALKEFRYDAMLRGVTFGWNAIVERGAGALLRVGDTVTVRRRAPHAR